MRFSFITCTYNRSELLKKNIESVKKNKFKSFEHFIVDDGSTDDTVNIVKKYNINSILKQVSLEKSSHDTLVFFSWRLILNMYYSSRNIQNVRFLKQPCSPIFHFFMVFYFQVPTALCTTQN